MVIQRIERDLNLKQYTSATKNRMRNRKITSEYRSVNIIIDKLNREGNMTVSYAGDVVIITSRKYGWTKLLDVPVRMG